MPAGVMEGVERAGIVAHDEHLLAVEAKCPERQRLGGLARATHVYPVALPDRGEVAFERLGPEIRAAGQRRLGPGQAVVMRFRYRIGAHGWSLPPPSGHRRRCLCQPRPKLTLVIASFL